MTLTCDICGTFQRVKEYEGGSKCTKCKREKKMNELLEGDLWENETECTKCGSVGITWKDMTDKPVCAKCISSSISRVDKVSQVDGMVISELLCFAQTHIHRAPKKYIIESIAGFYSEEEIKEAKQLLWDN